MNHHDRNRELADLEEAFADLLDLFLRKQSGQEIDQKAIINLTRRTGFSRAWNRLWYRNLSMDWKKAGITHVRDRVRFGKEKKEEGDEEE